MAASTSGMSWGGLLLAAFLLLLVSPADGTRHLIRRILQRWQNQHQQHHFQENVTLGLNPGSYHESGPWGPWTANSSCSRTCGGGVAYQTRVCEDFRADGTHGCVGPAKRYFSCNVEECPDYTKDFREEQCARFNSIAFEGRYYSWVPYYKAANPCELNCRPIGERFYYRHSPKTIDGTRCHDDGSLDVCVNGACMPVGCDRMLGSDAVKDKCGKCRGDGTSCSTIDGVFDLENREVGESIQSLYPLGSDRETKQFLTKSGDVSRGSNFCVLPKQEGNCTEYLDRWYYNAEEGRCRQFYYSGCGGNANNFVSSRDCEQMCWQPASTDIAEEEFQLAFCFMDSEAGPCNKKEVRWFYDKEDGVCREFYYGGCQGNHNRFMSHRECEEECSHAQDLCDLPQVPGNCREKIPQWFYNPVTQRCQEFNYSGCQGNANRFNDRESCELRCPPLPTEQPVDHVTPLVPSNRRTPKPGTIGKDGYSTATGEVSGERAEGSCEATKFGCCQDKIRAAKGPDFGGCGNCSDSLFGCCEDNTTFALGASGEGCCVVTEFGCCRDNVTAASAEGCLCNGTRHGCCPDNVTIALGPGFEGCTCDHCAFGCCPDKKTAADGPEFEGCFNCTNTTFGCCPDEVTAAQGPNFEGCEGFETNCTNTTFGCCPGGLSAAEGENFVGCVVACESTAFGCCPDGLTPASGIGFEGCDNCSESLYGCCADNASFVLGPGGEGCCFHTKFGCCQDNKTEAQGPDFAGCSCHTTPHGCCPDGVSTARGPWYYGCTCHNYPFGCCQDEHTAAWGPNFEGCLCSRLLYGCCPDDLTPARGPNLAGCSCATMPYGCCPDQRTPARGPAFGGCPCTAMPYGCCPDQQTAAHGPDGMGCECEKLAYGCCPDDRTAATGPRLTGCTCHHYPHGCCPDGRTPARGPDADGCTCAMSAYGCCPDGVTDARGCNFEGCPLDPRISAPTRNDLGPCRNYSVNWFFSVADGRCTRFWYGGCEGNGNRFNSQEECEETCVKPQGPVSRDVCAQPKEEGPCRGAIVHWYYNMAAGRCEQFYYGGCQGNANRFETRRECERACISSGGRNVCMLPQEAGNCVEFRERWYYNAEEGRCHRFYYGGCDGNANNFGSRLECEQVCRQPVPTDVAEEEFRLEFCFMAREAGPCKNMEVRWFYDKEDGVCRAFYYGGCQGNRNRFRSHRECKEKCYRAQDACAQPKRPGPCYGVLPMWYYDADSRECRNFTYGGCEGNDNRFESREHCEERCAFFVRPVIPTRRTPKPGTIGKVDTPDSELDEDKAPTVPWLPSTRREPPDSGEELDPRNKPPMLATPVPNEEQATEPLPRQTAATECPPSNCEELQCPLGKNQTVDHRGCVQCRCSNPCETFLCREEELCRIEAHWSVDHRPNYRPICRLVNKPGHCPVAEVEAQPAAMVRSICRDVCRVDADCPDVHKCCYNGCAHVCVSAVVTEISAALTSTATQAPISTTEPMTEAPTTPHHQPPQSHGTHRNGGGHSEALPAKTEVTAHAGSDVTLPCLDRPFPIVHVSWTFRDEPVESNEGRFKILVNHSLHISQLSGDDAGPYRCTADDGHRTVSHVTNLVVYVPATIRPSDARVSVRVSETARLACVVVGFPRPSVQWYRGGKLLPKCSARYATLGDFTLVIRNVKLEDKGIYTCRAYNYHRDPAVWKVSLSVLPPSPSRPDWRRRWWDHLSS
ncbi:uncharacterized protein LOC144148277 [Haemaphysalis longicornis]